MSYEDPAGPNANFYHGEDVNLYSADPGEFRRNIEEFHKKAKNRFHLLHFAGDGLISFFPENWHDRAEVGEDIREWRGLGKKIAYTISGCNSGVTQTTVAQWSELGGGRAVCDVCAWRLRPDVCSDKRNRTWGRKLSENCDLIFAETSPALDYLDTDRTVFEPTTMCLDSTSWNPDLKVPEAHRIDRQSGELLVYHAVGNYDSRTQGRRNIKGTHSLTECIDRLRAEGIPVRLIFATGIPNREVRYLQVQADIIVDQLNYGRYGANTRESLMLGKPTICHINRLELKAGHELVSLSEAPLISANEQSVYHAVKRLVSDSEMRARLGQASREYALKWHSSESCAERYEALYDQVMAGKRPQYPYPEKHINNTCKPGFFGEHPAYRVGM